MTYSYFQNQSRGSESKKVKELDMNKQLLQIAGLGLLISGLTACQKPAGSSAETVAGLEVESLSAFSKACSEQPSSNVSIVGIQKVVSDKVAQLSLSSGVNCDDAALAVWKVGNTVIGYGQSISTQFNGSGSYVISVEIPNAAEIAALESARNVASKVTSSTENSVLVVEQSLTVSNSGIVISGPQLGTEGFSYTYSLAIPTGVSVTSVAWDFNDGSGVVSSLSPVQHNFVAGIYSVSAQITKADGTSESLQQSVTILPFPDGKFCPLDQLAIVGPTEVPVQRLSDFSLNISSCLSSLVTQVQWNFGDGTNPVSGSSVRHAFETAGTYEVSVSFTVYGNSVTVVRSFVVTDNLDPLPPGPTPAPNPNGCAQLGATRVIDGESIEETMTCGLDGQKTMSYINKVSQTCSVVGSSLEWVTQGTQKTLVSEGACTAQSCLLVTESGTEKLIDGASKPLYTTKTPQASCTDVQVTRVCNNGVLSGSDAAQFLSCNAGCGEFGVHGTVNTGVVTGSTEVAKSCQFGEAGVTSTVNLIADMTCSSGEIVSSNTRQGDVTREGVCPTYSWVATENYTACSAACGGSQDRVYECKNNLGQISDSARCSGQAPQESRVCDGDPQSVFKTSTVVTHEEANTCQTCPKNQIGIIVQTRDVTTTTTMACVDHAVQTSSEVQNGAWVKESYCQDFTPKRCSSDSLSNDMAHGRYAWMVKCQDSSPAIKDFLAMFEDVKSQGFGLNTPGRVLYPTFMDSSTKKIWKAPTNAKAECAIPPTAYVAGVCVSSCSTPEQQILVDAREGMKYMSFVDALVSKVEAVKTLHDRSAMSSKELRTTKVENWVTEIEDADHQILVFKTQSGGSLRVTTNHPILSEKGTMKLAQDFKVGESLIQLGGKLDPIVSIEPVTHHGKVYNLFVKSSSPQQNVVVIGGFLNGTAFFQNEGSDQLNRVLFRQSLIKGVFSGVK